MNKILGFFKANKAASALVAAAVLVLMIAFAMQGCSLGSWIKHDVPRDIQKYNDGASKVSLVAAPYVLEDYLDGVERNVQRFIESNEKAEMVRGVLSSLVTIGLEEAGTLFPGAGILSGLLLGFAGLMTRKPGTAAEMATEKMASFNGGQDVMAEKLKGMLSEDAIRKLVADIKAEIKGEPA